jgi:predicted alpha/beta superfamily hydrolase
MVTEILVPAIGPNQTEERQATDLRRHTLTSELLGGERQLIVFVPEGYDADPERRYPVLYMQDGQNLFDPATSYVPGKYWRLDQTAQWLIREGRIEPIIIVGIYHAAEKRVDEYTPTKDAKRNGGKGDKYLKALTEEIKPFIDREYRTHSCPWNTAIGGSSLGGLLTLYAGLEYPQVFGKLAVMSPSAWWDRRFMVRRVDKLSIRPRLSIWLDIGTREGAGTLVDARALRQALEEKGWRQNADLRYFEATGAAHDEAAWADRVAPMLEFLFPLTM